MKKILILVLILQLLLISGFFVFAKLADEAMDKTGIGDYQEFSRLSQLSGKLLLCAGAVWFLVFILSVYKKQFGTAYYQYAIAYPPTFLVLGLFLYWLT